ncbi:MAG: ATP-binding cassette domain-containing protein, partial [Methanomassiliicoccales archaeon]|nr:ATP-binding cassette domain-containing protein [Methanomassiliicoccales archaeon]
MIFSQVIIKGSGSISEAVIEVHDLLKTYGDLKAVDNISFDVIAGEVFSLLGPNGAGKTTTVEI